MAPNGDSQWEHPSSTPRRSRSLLLQEVDPEMAGVESDPEGGISEEGARSFEVFGYEGDQQYVTDDTLSAGTFPLLRMPR